jgi:transcription initiation factor TFIID subunit 7
MHGVAHYIRSRSNFFHLVCFAVELHKTHDHAMYYKCVDIAQILIVYEDEMAMEEAEAIPKSEGFPSYLPSGLTPPMKRAVERFEAREHKAVAPPKHEVGEVEIELQGLMDRITKDAAGRTKKLKNPAHVRNKIVD